MAVLPLLLVVASVVILVLKMYLKISEGVCRSTKSVEGMVVIVTGANSGIGFETALDLAKRGGRVVLACRSTKRGDEAAKKIKNLSGNSDVVAHQLDLSSMDSVRQFAAIINTTEERLDVLIHNAGVTPEPGLYLTKDNLELQFATNHFGPFLLTHLLLDLLKRSSPSRIVVVSSITHLWATLDLDNLNCQKYTRHPYWIYCSTKLANILFVRELSRRLTGSGVTVNALHPGGVRTSIARHGQWFIKYLIVPVIYFFLKSCKSGAQTTIYLAVENGVRNTSGEYFVDCKPSWVSSQARNDVKASRLWELSEEYTGIQFK